MTSNLLWFRGAVVVLFFGCSTTGVTTPSSGPNAGGAADGGAGPPAPPPPPALADTPCVPGSPLPQGSYFAAPGVEVRLVAAGVSGLRQVTFAPNGDLFGTSGGGAIWLLRDDDKDGAFKQSEIHLWAETGGNGNNSHLDVASGYLYAGTMTGVKRFKYTAGELKGGAGEDVVVGQPVGGHSLHTTHVYDGILYVHSGSGGNITHEGGPTAVDYDTKRSVIKRFDLSKLVPGTPFQWDAGEPYTVGLRNASGFTRNELTGKIYSVVNGLDNVTYLGSDVHLDNPGEQVVEVAAGKKYGYPFCYTAQRLLDAKGGVLTPGTQVSHPGWTGAPHDDAWCAANSLPPTTFIQAHSAPLDITFLDKQPQGGLPERWRGGAFIALHGSWNRETTATGYKVVWMPFNADGTAPMPTSTTTTTTFPYEVVFGGGSATAAKDGGWGWSDDTSKCSESGVRPAGLAISPIDGSLYVSSDAGGVLYRVKAR